MASAVQCVNMAAIQSSSSDELWSTQNLKGDGVVANVGSGQEPRSGAVEHGQEPQVRQVHKM